MIDIKNHIEGVKTSMLALMKEKSNNLRNFFKENHQNESCTLKSNVSLNNDNAGKKNHKSFWDCFKEISSSSTASKVDIDNKNDDVDESALFQELTDYLSKPVIERETSPFNWWRINETNFPMLSKLAKSYLSAPASSIYSERLFSEAGLIYEKKRNRILPKNAEELLFLHHNLRILKKDSSA